MVMASNIICEDRDSPAAACAAVIFSPSTGALMRNRPEHCWSADDVKFCSDSWSTGQTMAGAELCFGALNIVTSLADLIGPTFMNNLINLIFACVDRRTHF